MQLKLRLNRETEHAVKEELHERGIEVSEEATLTLTEDAYRAGTLTCRDGTSTVVVPLEHVCYLEAQGHDVWVHVGSRRYKTRLRIYRLEALLPAEQFIRISNAVIIRRDSIRRITPALSQRFHLTLTCGDVVDVTRTYYCKFKEFYGI